MTNSNNALEKLRYHIQVVDGDCWNDIRLDTNEFLHGRIKNGYVHISGPIAHSKIQEVYMKTRSIRELLNKYGLKPKAARNVLKIAGIDFPADLAAEYHAEKSIGYLAKKHGMKEKTISNILKSVGVKVRKGNAQIPPQNEDLKRVFEECGSIKRAALSFKIHQITAKKYLIEAGLLPKNTKMARTREK